MGAEVTRGTFIACLVVAFSGYANAEDRPVVAVFDIEMRNVGRASEKANDLTDYLCSLLAGKGLQVVPRAKLKESLVERKKASYRQCYDQACQIEIGKELAATKSLAAQVLALGGKCKLTLTLYDLRRGTSETGTAVSGGCGEDKIVESLERAVDLLMGSGSPKPPAPAACPNPWKVLVGKLESAGDCGNYIATAGDDGREYSVGWFEYAKDLGTDIEITVRVRPLTADTVITMEVYFLGGAFAVATGQYFFWGDVGQRFSGWRPTKAVTAGENEIRVVQKGRHVEAYVNGGWVGAFDLAADPNKHRAAVFFKGKKPGPARIGFRGFQVREF